MTLSSQLASITNNSSSSLPYLYRGPSELNDAAVIAHVTAAVDPDELFLNMDQSDERRYFASRQGNCFVNTRITSQGVFWIKPIASPEFDQRQLSDRIGRVLQKNNFKSFMLLGTEPMVNTKCFVLDTRMGRNLYKRGWIEYVRADLKECDVRLLDNGTLMRMHYRVTFPFARLDSLSLNDGNDVSHYMTPKYLTIRCCIDSKKVSVNKDLMNQLVFPGQCKFELREQVTIEGLKCWHTDLYSERMNSNRESTRVRRTFVHINSLLLNKESNCMKEQANASAGSCNYLLECLVFKMNSPFL